MITIAYQPAFWERIRAKSATEINVEGGLFPADGKPVWSYVATDDRGAELVAGVFRALRDNGKELTADPPGSDWEGAWCMADSPDGDRRYVALDNHMEVISDIRDALLELDKNGRLAVQSAQRWLAVAEKEERAGNFAKALQYAEAAWRRSRLPYIRLKTKDDTPLKFFAAKETFETSQGQGVAMAIGIARNHLKVLEQAWQ
jgi:hypothetical protein